MRCYRVRNDIFWYFRSKTLGINVATYAPIVGIPAQIIEVYLLGQFASYCAQNLNGFDAAGLDAQWCQIESTLISGEQLLSAIEVSIGKPLDVVMRSRLANAANTFSRAYLTAMGVPGLRTVQTKAVMGVRRVFDSVHKMARSILCVATAIH